MALKLFSWVLLLLLLAATATAAMRDDDIDEFDGLDDDEADFDGMMPPPVPDREPMNIPMIRRPPIMRPRPPLSAHNMTTLLMRAVEKKNVMLLMMMIDARTLIAHDSDLPTGGLFKGRRGMLEMMEAIMKNVKIVNSSYKIVNVDDVRNTATVVKTVNAVSRKTNTPFTARMMILIQYALQRVTCIDVIDLDYDVVKNAISTPAEKACAKLGENWFVNGPLASATLNLIADNVSMVFGAVSPKTIATISGKNEFIRLMQSKEKTDACKLVECLWNHTTYSNVVHADNSRVVTINFAGNFLRATKYVDRFSEGTIVHGVTRVDEWAKNSGVVVYFVLHEFDNDGKLTKAYTQLSRPLTLLDRVHLRNVHGITIPAAST